MEKLMTNYDLSPKKLRSSTTKEWKEKIQEVTINRAQINFTRISEAMSKMSPILEQKKEPKQEKYLTEILYKQARIIFLIRHRMLNLKNNHKNQYKNELSCRRCNSGIDNEQHLIEKCESNKNHRTPECSYQATLKSNTASKTLQTIANLVINTGITN